MNAAFYAGEVRGHGRSKALLSTADEFNRLGADVTIYADVDSWEFNRLAEWHGFEPNVPFRRGEWGSDPDLAIAWAKPLASRIASFECPTVAWVESGGAPSGIDIVWCPSAQAAESIDGPVRVVYPTHYLRHLPKPVDRNRDIDVLAHNRKAAGLSDRLEPGVNAVTTGSFDHETLIEHYNRSKAFVHPKRKRSEPLGLMPLEAAYYGCKPFVPKDAGAAELLPGNAYDDPIEAAAEWFESEREQEVPA